MIEITIDDIQDYFLIHDILYAYNDCSIASTSGCWKHMNFSFPSDIFGINARNIHITKSGRYDLDLLTRVAEKMFEEADISEASPNVKGDYLTDHKEEFEKRVNEMKTVNIEDIPYEGDNPLR